MISPYFDQEQPQAPIVGLIADSDKSEPYELDAMAVFKLKGKGFLVVHVSGCSCWPDRGGTTQTICNRKTDVEKAVRDFDSLLVDKLQQVSWKVQKKEVVNSPQ